MIPSGGVTSLLQLRWSHTPVFLAIPGTRSRLESLVEPVVTTLSKFVALVTAMDEALLIDLGIHLYHADRRTDAGPLSLDDYVQFGVSCLLYMLLRVSTPYRHAQ